MGVTYVCVYLVYPMGPGLPVLIYSDMSTDGHVWTVRNIRVGVWNIHVGVWDIRVGVCVTYVCVYLVYPMGPGLPVPVYCNMSTDGHVWTVQNIRVGVCNIRVAYVCVTYVCVRNMYVCVWSIHVCVVCVCNVCV